MEFKLSYYLKDQEGQIFETIEKDNLRQVKRYCSKLDFIASVTISFEGKIVFYKRNIRTIRKQ